MRSRLVNTPKRLQTIPDDGSPVLVCSDYEAERHRFTERLGLRALPRLSSEGSTEAAASTFLEFFALSRAKTIVLSQR